MPGPGHVGTSGGSPGGVRRRGGNPRDRCRRGERSLRERGRLRALRGRLRHPQQHRPARSRTNRLQADSGDPSRSLVAGGVATSRSLDTRQSAVPIGHCASSGRALRCGAPPTRTGAGKPADHRYANILIDLEIGQIAMARGRVADAEAHFERAHGAVRTNELGDAAPMLVARILQRELALECNRPIPADGLARMPRRLLAMCGYSAPWPGATRTIQATSTCRYRFGPTRRGWPSAGCRWTCRICCNAGRNGNLAGRIGWERLSYILHHLEVWERGRTRPPQWNTTCLAR